MAGGEGASPVLVVFALSMPGYLVSVAAQFFLEAMHRPKAGMWAMWIANGVNLPAIEYAHQTGQTQPAPAQNDEAIWFNEDRDPFGPLWLRWRSGVALWEALLANPATPASLIDELYAIELQRIVLNMQISLLQNCMELRLQGLNLNILMANLPA